MKEKGADCPVGFPDTAYSLPVIYSLLGRRVDRLSDMQRCSMNAVRCCRRFPMTRLAAVSGQHARRRHGHAVCVRDDRSLQVSDRAGSGEWHLAGRGQRRDYSRARHRVRGWLGAGFCRRGRSRADRRDTPSGSPASCRRRTSTFSSRATPTACLSPSSLRRRGVQIGWETRLVPFGKEISAAIYALGFANRVALSFGGVQPGDYAAQSEIQQGPHLCLRAWRWAK